MGVGEHFLIFHHHHRQRRQEQQHDHIDDKMNIPKGCVAVVVGHEDEEQKKFIIPLMYMKHPLFMELLKEAEEEYEFHHEGPVNIPCHVEDFYKIKNMIDHHHHTAFCFKY